MEAKSANSTLRQTSELKITQIRNSPLCVFTLSPPFQLVLATSRRPNNTNLTRRRSLPKVRPRFKKKCLDVPLLYYLNRGECHDERRRQRIHRVQDILNIVREVWKNSYEQSLSSPTYEEKMNGGNRFGKISCNSSDNPHSPILLRRRLSAPEIVMRKHTLAQQRSDSYESETTQTLDARSCQSRNEFSLGSDNSLNRKCDSNFMRKSTLLRNFWRNSNSKTLKDTQSSKSSPRTSPKHNKNRINLSSPKRLQNSNTETDFETTASLNNSDSAFSNSRTHFTGSSNSDIEKLVVGYSCSEDENKNCTGSIKNSETQTLGTTNVNIISNVQLSKKTLDIIYNQVLKDVKNSVPDMININSITVTPEPKRINVQQVPRFYLKNREEPKQMLISNIFTGSSYTKSNELPQIVVPRFSAYPRTASMEVNISSADSTDKESDTISLVDSLEDPTSPHNDYTTINKHDDKPVRGSISSLLPDTSYSITKKTKSTNKAFFIPIETDAEQLEKAVSEHLPEKVRERLSKRQMELKSKSTSPRSDSNYVSSSDSHIIVGSDNTGNLKYKKRVSKPLLPSIQTTRKIKIDTRDNVRSRRYQKKQTVPTKIQTRTKQKLTPLYTTKNEYHYDSVPKRIYHKTELNNVNKRIELLEIMECIDVAPEKYTQRTKIKSKIPVLVQPKLPKLNQQKPTFLEVQEVRIEDPKIDQLIANILIDTLNKTEDSDDTKIEQKQKKQHEDEKKPNKYYSSNKYQQKFEVIPEEFLQSSIESINNDSATVNVEEKYEETKNDLYKGKAALALVKDDNLTTIPQGWITFYMLQNSQGSPDNTSDEGKTTNKCETKNDEQNPPEMVEGKTKSTNKILPQIHNCSDNKTKQRGWSITVSGTNSYDDLTPNLEMKLNFSQKKTLHFTDTSHYDCDVSSNENGNYHTCKLPNINKEEITSRKGKRCETNTKNEPRQTKTSSKRISLNRLNQLPLVSYSNLNVEDNNNLNSEQRQLEESLKRFPHFLSITGNAIHQGKRPRIYTDTEK